MVGGNVMNWTLYVCRAFGSSEFVILTGHGALAASPVWPCAQKKSTWPVKPLFKQPKYCDVAHLMIPTWTMSSSYCPSIATHAWLALRSGFPVDCTQINYLVRWGR